MSDMPLWFPYAQMKTMPTPLKVASAQGVCLHLEDGRTLVDAIASWWCVIHGYNHPVITAAAKDQLDRMSHVMMCGLTHTPAEELARTLVAITPDGLNHCFFSDSGSVGVEVAMKIAVQYWLNQGCTKKTRLLAFEKAYHGDTTGCMALCDPSDGMHCLFAGILPQHFRLPAPSEDVDGDMRRLEAFFEEHASETAALIIEPLLQAAGGFNIYPAAWLQRAREVCDRYDVLLIFDEVATGFGRTGTLFAADQAGVTPDVMVLGKGLTAGYCGLAATLATDKVFQAFYSESPSHALMHGPTFMGNPLACAIARASIQVFEDEGALARVARVEAQLRSEWLPMRGEGITGVRVLGACAVVEVENPTRFAGMQNFAAERGIWLRPFGRWIYTMPPYIISEDELARVISVVRDWFLRTS